MNDDTDRLGQADEDILAHTVSDEVLEAAAGPEKVVGRTYPSYTGLGCHFC